MAETGLNYTSAMRMMDAEDAARAADTAHGAPVSSLLDGDSSADEPTQQTADYKPHLRDDAL